MKTLVIQSYNENKEWPQWIRYCHDQVEAYCRRHQFDYLHYGDEIFKQIPGWVLQKSKFSVYPKIDLARLMVMQQALESGVYDRVVWMDADLLIFNPDEFTIPTTNAFSHELSIQQTGRDYRLQGLNAPCNAMMVFVGPRVDVGNRCPLLAAYIEQALEKLQETNFSEVNRYADAERCVIGPGLLKQTIAHLGQLPIMREVANFTQPHLDILKRLYLKDGIAPPIIHEYERQSRRLLVAANLCHFIRKQLPGIGHLATWDKEMLALCQALVSDKGLAFRQAA